MDKPESEIEFVERVVARWNDEGEMVGQDMLRLFALARRGAEANAKWQAGYNAAKAASLPPPPVGEQE